MATIRIGWKLRAWIAALTSLAISACGGGGGSSGATSPAANLTPASPQAGVSELADAFAATLTGGQVVPQRPSSATGSGTVVIQPATRLMTATLMTTGIAGTAAHIQQAPAGLNGPIIYPLAETMPGSGIWATRVILSEAQYAAFRAGDFYFSVQSANFANGEIRGQILSQQPGTTPATATNNSGATGTTATGAGLNPFVTSTATFLAALRGAHGTPPTASTALGSGTVLLNPVNRQVTAGVTISGMTASAAHIQEGAPGTNGPVVIGLAESATGSGIWTASTILTEAQSSALQAGNFYFNVRSSAFPNGEIRGQILPQTISLEFITGAAGRLGSTDTTGAPPAIGTTGTGTTATGATPASGSAGLVF